MVKPMNITKIKTYLVGATASLDGWTDIKPLLFVKIETDAGLHGWGEAYVLEGRERAIEQIVFLLAQGLTDREAPGPRAFRRHTAFRIADKRNSFDFHCASSALELALWDLEGKRLGAPVYQLLGGAIRPEIPLYANTWSDRSPSLQQMVDRAVRLKQDGFSAVKIYPMEFSRLDESEDFVARVREAVGPDTDIMIDMNVMDDPHVALEAARRFEPHHPFWFEEPVTSDDLETLSYVRSRVTMRVVSGERHSGKYKFREMLERRVTDVLNPDIAGCGGILELLEIAAMAETFSVAVSPHNYNSTTVAMAAMLHVSALIPNLLMAELYPSYVDLGRQFAQCSFEITDGSATLPGSPGLGVEVDEEALLQFSGKTA